MLDWMYDVVKAMKENFDFAKRARCLYDYYFNNRVRTKDLWFVYEIDEKDGKKKPFWNLFGTLEDLWLHIRIKMEGDNLYGNIYEELVEIMKQKKSANPEYDSAEIMLLFMKACANCTKKDKKPFFITIKKLNDK